MSGPLPRARCRWGAGADVRAVADAERRAVLAGVVVGTMLRSRAAYNGFPRIKRPNLTVFVRFFSAGPLDFCPLATVKPLALCDVNPFSPLCSREQGGAEGYTGAGPGAAAPDGMAAMSKHASRPPAGVTRVDLDWVARVKALL